MSVADRIQCGDEPWPVYDPLVPTRRGLPSPHALRRPSSRLAPCEAGCGRRHAQDELTLVCGSFHCRSCLRAVPVAEAERRYRATVPLAERAHAYLERTGRMARINRGNGEVQP